MRSTARRWLARGALVLLGIAVAVALLLAGELALRLLSYRAPAKERGNSPETHGAALRLTEGAHAALPAVRTMEATR